MRAVEAVTASGITRGFVVEARVDPALLRASEAVPARARRGRRFRLGEDADGLTWLTAAIKQKLLVAFRACDRAFHDLGGEIRFFHSTPALWRTRLHAARRRARFRLCRPVPCRLRTAASPAPPFRPGSGFRYAHHRGENQRGRNEADIADRQIDWLAEIGQFEISGVEAFVHDDARIAAQLPVELAGADVDGMDARRAVLQQAIGEAACGGTEIGGRPALSRR